VQRRLRQGEAGFTLLEVLVVVTLIAIVGAAVGLAIGGRGDSELEAGAERLLGALNHAREAAVVSGRPHGLFITPTAYEMVTFDGVAWRSAAAGGSGAAHALSPPYVLVGAAVHAARGAAPDRPQVLFLPDGTQHYAGLALTNTVSGESSIVDVAGAGRLRLVRASRE
jgi:type II secretion system protein H